MVLRGVFRFLKVFFVTGALFAGQRALEPLWFWCWHRSVVGIVVAFVWTMVPI